MNSLGKILLYFIGVAVIGALLSPPLFWGVEKLKPWAMEQGYLKYEIKDGDKKATGSLGFLETDFGKISNRAHLITALLLFWPMFRSLKIRNVSMLGLEPNPHRWRHFAIGYGITLLVMTVLGLLLLKFGVYRMKDPPPWSGLIGITISGLVVATLEGWMFRGAFQGLFRQSLGKWGAVAMASGLFALVHFLKPPETPIQAEHVNWLSGFALFPQRFVDFANPALLLGEFATLFLLAWVLGWTVLRTKSLWLGIGIHAAIVLGKFGFNRLTKRPKDMRDLLPWIGEDMAIGVIALGVVALIWLIVWLFIRKNALDR